MRFGPHWSKERRFWRPRVDRDVDDELAFHLAMRAELLERTGLDPQTARDRALERFGDLDAVRDHCLVISHQQERRMKRGEMWSMLAGNARHALRRLAASPGFTLAVLAMLSIGVGATAAVFGVIDGVLLRPLPFERPDRLVDLSHSINIAGMTVVPQSDASVLLYQRHATSAFQRIGAYRSRDVTLGALGGQIADAERAPGAGVTAGLFPTLGVVPQRGRLIRPDDDRPRAPRVAIISDALWRRKFGGDPSVIGKQLVVDGLAREVVGIMPADFAYPAAATAVWLPLALDPSAANPGSFNFIAVGRLADGATPAAAQRELARHLPRLLDEFPSDIPRDMWAEARVTPVVRPLRDVVIGDIAPLLWTLFGSVALLLVIVCANIAGLFLVRAEGAQRDLAIRVALGASAGALALQHLAEALLLAVGGGVVGLLLARLAITLLHASPAAAELPRLAEVTVDARVAAFAIAVVTLCAIAVTLLPMLRVRRVSPGVVLKESSRSASTGRERQRARSILVVAQVAMALVLVASSALMARSFSRLQAVEPGFDARNVLTVRVALPRATYGDAAARVGFVQRVLEQARALPGVVSAAVTEWLPLTDDHNDSVVQIEDHPLPSSAVPPDHPLAQVSPDFFTALGIPVLRGRTFQPAGAARPSTEVLVSRAFAQRYWPDKDPVGRRLRPSLGGPWYTIVGVVGDVHMATLDGPPEEFIYFPLVMPAAGGGAAPDAFSVVVRTTGDAASLGAPLRGIFRSIDPALASYDERTMAARLSNATARMRFIMLMLGTAGLLSLVVGMVGLYAVLAYGVSLRRREIGVRLALGASAADVTRMIARRGIAMAACGVLLGLAAAVATTRLMRGLLYGISPTDPVTLGGACIMLLLAAGVASWLPARRAAGIEPMEALRRD